MENAAEAEIRARIARHGRVTFAEFMDVALYHPHGGYYATSSAVGARGDYFTSPAAHPAFGALIAVQLGQMWDVLGRPKVFHAVEMGAGNRLLGRDVVELAKKMPGPFAGALRYVDLERSPLPSDRDELRRGGQRVVTEEVPLRGIVGCFLSNELVDSFPVHRFQVSGGAVEEAYVTLHDNEFVEFVDEPSTPLLAHRLEGLGFPLPDGYRGEVNLGVAPWMKRVADALDAGFVLTIDYGYEAAELYNPRRAHGTLQTYYRHTQAASPYRRIGEQDMTAHVDFSSVMAHGTNSGLGVVGLESQSEFLDRLGFQRLLYRLRSKKLGQRERDSNVMAMRELVKPGGLGGFKVLVQEKGTDVACLAKITPLYARPGEPGVRDDALPVPLLKPYHVPLLEGRYPHLSWASEDLWPNESNTDDSPE